ncbi:MAG: anaerobic glycerol-3-phosphate dehydrogenase subunit A [Desulfovibrio sp.]|jgi:glycerol-3-phosphate dehydrogenase|nr:anaerobic glycerol-3-phosphate dehydrogenase subunit A [Desulfovibrio sp.]
MQKLNDVSVVVVGGGATGVGLARDIAMRGVSCLLVEQGDLCAGATSRFHGLLHSGARYAVGDPEAASECARENAILRRIAPECVEQTEGFFVGHAEDDPAWEAKWAPACARCGIPAVPVEPREALGLEPELTADVRAVYRVPDSAVDGFRMVLHNAVSAERYGARILTYTRLTGIETRGGRVVGVWLERRGAGEKCFVACEYLVSAAGAWAGETARLAGLEVGVSPDRGLLLAFNHRFTERVINRLRKPADGDIFVPHGTVVIYGTTSVPVRHPGDTGVETEEVLRLLSDGEKLFPRLRDYRMLRAFAGTRPLYAPDSSTGRSATRNFVIVDHEKEGLSGMATVTGGKFTSFRLMAEKTADLVCARLGVHAPCRTAEERLTEAPSEQLIERARNIFPADGMRLAAERQGGDFERTVAIAEQARWKKSLLCECEFVTYAEFEAVASQSPEFSLGDIRRRTRMGMGTCQGNFCALRAGAALAEINPASASSPRKTLEEFLEERWRGIRPLLWGRQLREVELERGIYAALMNLEGPQPTSLPARGQGRIRSIPAAKTRDNPQRPAGDDDVIVVGAGLAGITAALRAAHRGRKVVLLSAGAGVLSISSGSIDVLGVVNNAPICGDPFASFDDLAPEHPYSLVGAAVAADAVDFIASRVSEAGLPLHVPEKGEGNIWLPTAVGTLKPVFAVGPGMSPLTAASSAAVAGIRGLKDFSAVLAAKGLSEHPLFAGKTFSPLNFDAPRHLRATGRDLTSLDISRFVDTPAGTDWLRKELASLKAASDTILLPAVLGVDTAAHVQRTLEEKLDVSLVECVCPPPAVSGLRMQKALFRALRKAGVRVFDNVAAQEAIVENRDCRGLVVRQGGIKRIFTAKSYVIATGGVYGKGISSQPGSIFERIFHLPVAAPARLADWANERFFSHKPHAFATLGVRVNKELQAVAEDGTVALSNVHFAGSILRGYDFATEKSGSGVAVATGYAAGDRV